MKPTNVKITAREAFTQSRKYVKVDGTSAVPLNATGTLVVSSIPQFHGTTGDVVTRPATIAADGTVTASATTAQVRDLLAGKAWIWHFFLTTADGVENILLGWGTVEVTRA